MYFRVLYRAPFSRTFIERSILDGIKCTQKVPWTGQEQGGRFYSTSKYRPPGKLSYMCVPGDHPLLDMTVGQLINWASEMYSDQEVVVVSNPNEIRKTYTQFKKDTDDFAAGLLKLGLQKGDRIGIWGPNSYEWFLTHFAGMKAGLAVVNINPAYQTREISYCLNKVGIKCLVISEPFKNSNYHEMVLKAVPEAEASDLGKIKSSKAPQLTTLISFDANTPRGTYAFQEVLDKGRSSESQKNLQNTEKAVQFDDVCNIQFTSGTTGNPKGVMLSHHNIVNNGFLVGRRFGLHPTDKLCLPVPLFHCYGNVVGVMSALHNGSTCIFPSPGFSPPHALSTISKEKCTVIFGTPTMHIDMIHHPEFDSHDVSSLRLASTAGSICPEELIRLMKSKYTVDGVVSAYGMTETSPASYFTLPTDTDTLRAETVGYPLEHTEAKIIDAEGKIVPVGEQGELCIRGYLNMLGYWEDPEKTNETIDSARWLRTGDLCVMTETGHVRIVGRLKDMIIRGGENVYPREVEDFLHTHPDVQEAQIVGVPDKRMGEELAAWICLKEGHSLNEADLKAFCKGKIAHYKIPKYIIFTKEYPKTTSGKIQKFILKDETIKRFGIEVPKK